MKIHNIFFLILLLVIQIQYSQQLNKRISKKNNQETIHSLDNQYNYTEIVKQIKNYVQNPNEPQYHSAYERLAYIVDTYGPRLWGSETLELVIDDLYKQGQELEFDKVYKDPVINFTKWVRKEESLTLYDPRPYPQNIKLIGLGMSVPGDVKAEVLVVTSFEDLELRKSQAKGKIVCYSVEWEGYDKTVEFRAVGAAKAAQYGAVGVLVRSVTPFSIESPHTGSTHYQDGVKKIPAAAISVEDANMFLRMRNRGQKIVVHLKMDNEQVENSQSSNVIAEITGTEYPDEIVLFGGHIDSWDTGSQTGANDDGGGFITCFEALRVIQELGLKPRRTMRFIAWSGEEYGYEQSGAAQYVNQRKNQMKNHVLAFESDLGSTKPYGFGFTGNQDATEMVSEIIQSSFEPIECTTVTNDGNMTDNSFLGDLGVPTMKNLIWDIDEQHPYYFTFHHSAGDSMDLMDADDMDLNVIAIASMMFIAADTPSRIPQVTLPKFKGNHLLFHSCAHLNFKDIQALLEDNEADVNARNINGSTPLHYGVQVESVEVCKLLLDYKANPNIQDNHDVGEKTPLLYAVEKNLIEVAQVLLDAGANPNIKDKRGLTCLHYAARNGFKEMVQLLLTAGSDVNIRDNQGFNASFWAEMNKHEEILKMEDMPAPQSIKPMDMCEFKMQMREIHKITVKLPKKKKKKKKK